MTIQTPPPLPGDPDAIRGYAARYSDTAAALQRAAAELRMLADESVTVTIAIDKVRERAALTAGEADTVATRYEGAAGAFFTYARGLEAAQDKADVARARIDAFDETARRWESTRRSLAQEELFVLGPPSPELVEAEARVAGFQSEFASAMALYEDAREDVREAARIARLALETARAAAAVDDTILQRITATAQQGYELLQKYFGTYVTVVRAGLELVRAVLDGAAFMFGAIGFLVPVALPIAYVLKTLSAVVSVQIASTSLTVVALGRAGAGTAIKDSLRAGRDAVERAVSILRIARGGPAAGVVEVVQSAADDVLPASPGKVAGEMGWSISDNLLEYGFDVRYDAFPNPGGPAWGEQGATALSPNWTWHHDRVESGEMAAEIREDVALDALKLGWGGGFFEKLNEIDEEWDEFNAVISGSGS